MSMRHIVKITKYGSQLRINLPKLLVEELKLDELEFIVLERVNVTQILMRKIIDGKLPKKIGQSTGNQTY